MDITGNVFQNLVRKLKERGHFKDLGVDRSTILKLTMKIRYEIVN